MLSEVESAVKIQYGNMIERRAAQLTMLNRISEEISSALEVHQILERTVQVIQKSFGYYHVGVYLPDEATGDLVLTASAGSFSNRFPTRHALKPGQGIVGWVYQHHKSILGNEINFDPRYFNLYPDRVPARSLLAVPILTAGNALGVMDLQSPNSNAFDQHDLEIMETVARQLSVALEKGRLYEQLQVRLQKQERAEELMRLQRDILAGLSSTQDFNQALHVILDSLTHIKGIDCGSIYLVNENGGLDAVTHIGLTPEFTANVSHLPPQAHKSQFVREGRTAYICYTDLPFDPRISDEARSNEAILSMAVLPISYQSRVIADLTLGSHILHDIPLEARNVLESVAAQLGITIARIQAENALTASEARNSALLEAIPDPLFLCDSFGRFIYSKQGSDTEPFLPLDNFPGKTMHEIMPKDIADLGMQALNQALATHITQSFIFRPPQQPDGYFEARVSATSNDQAVIIVRNITERFLAQSSPK
jgi:GAF domain-containing protein